MILTKSGIEKILRVVLVLFVLFNVADPSIDANAQGMDKNYRGNLSEQILKTSLCPTSGDLVVDTGEICSFAAGEYDFGSVVIESGGTVIVSGDTITGTGTTIRAQSMTINGVLDATGEGYLPGEGIGKGGVGNWAWGQSGGAGYGGSGGNGGTGASGPGGYSGPGGVVYGDVYFPLSLGSGGGNNIDSGVMGGRGGGAIKLLVGNQLTINGIISAHGLNGESTIWGGGGGGSGGSIWINADSILGVGEIKANGGNGGGSWYGVGGGGGGGRIAIYTNNLAESIQISVIGGEGGNAGSAGTSYFGVVDPILSTVTVTPLEPVVNSTDGARVTVMVKNKYGDPIPNQPVEIALASGPGILIGTTYVVLDEYVNVGVTDSNGVIEATLKTTQIGTREINFKTGQVLLPSLTVTFIADQVDPTGSLLYISSSNSIADGQTPVNVTVTALDNQGNPVPNAQVEILATGNAIVNQPTSTTSAQGKATGSIVNNTAEAVVVSAKVNGVLISGTQGVVFRGADMSLNVSGPTILTAGADMQYQIKVANLNGQLLQDVNLQVVLPGGFIYSGNTFSTPSSQNGTTLGWSLGDLDPGETITFNIIGQASTALNIGDNLQLQAAVTSSTIEESTTNNNFALTTSIVDGHSFETNISPQTATVSSNAETSYSILVANTGLLVDEFSITLSGLDPTWYELSETELLLAPGERKYIELNIQVDGCIASGSVNFSVNVTSSQSNTSNAAQINFQQNPVVFDIYPVPGTITSSTEMMFSWRTDVDTSGVLKVYPAGDPTNPQVIQSDTNKIHSVIVSELERTVNYEWYIESTSQCGMTNTPVQQLSVLQGIVFTSHEINQTIDRDYNQVRYIAVKNLDTEPQTVKLEIEDVYDDLIVNFFGSGSFEEEITLLPNETRQIQLVYFAQDAELESYDITAKLTSTKGEQTITDFAVIHVGVPPLEEINYVIEELGLHPTLHVMQYRIRNLGAPITDLDVSAVNRATGLPAPVILVPQINHMRLGRNEQIEFMAVPQYGPDQVTGFSSINSSFGLPASLSPDLSLEDRFDIVAAVAGGRKVIIHESVALCDKQIFAVTFDGPWAFTTPISSWYCPNKPLMYFEFFLNFLAAIKDKLAGGNFKLSFAPSTSSVNHSVSILLNGRPIGSIPNSVPNGDFNFMFDSDAINQGFGTNAAQHLEINTQWPYPEQDIAHYTIATGGEFTVTAVGVTVYVCADSWAEARQIAQDLYGIHPLPTIASVQIESPNPNAIVAPDSNGLINIQAFVSDDRDDYYNDYTVTAEVTYLDQFGHPTETFPLFDDGQANHKDLGKNDRYFNTLWAPQHGGEVNLKVTMTSINGLTDTAERHFTVKVEPDFEVKRVYIQRITREGEVVEVFAEITNNGFSVEGPVDVTFNYYNANDNGQKTGGVIYTKTYSLFGTIANSTFDHGEVIQLRDNTFTAPAVDLYYVEVIVDP